MYLKFEKGFAFLGVVKGAQMKYPRFVLSFCQHQYAASDRSGQIISRHRGGQ